MVDMVHGVHFYILYLVGGYGGWWTLDVFANLSPPLKLAALTDRRDKDAELIIRARLANDIELAALQNLCNIK